MSAAVLPLALADGILAFWLFAAIAVLAAGHTEHIEFASYVVAFFVILPATYGAAVIQSGLLIRRDRDSALALAAIDVGGLLVALLVARILWVVAPGAGSVAAVGGAAAVALVIARVVVLRWPASAGRAWLAARSKAGAKLVVPFALALGLILFLPRSVFGGGDWAVLLVVIAAAAETVLIGTVVGDRSQRISWRPSGRSLRALRRVVDVLAICAIVPALLIVAGSYTAAAIYHQGFFLAPANSVLHGGVMLVDVFSQYGVGVMYFLAAIFAATGIGYGVLATVVSALAILEFMVVYTILRLTIRSQALAIGAVAVAIVACDLTQFVPTYADFPSTTALRFGMPFLVILLARLARSGRPLSRVASASGPWLVGFSSFWSAETFFYTAGTYAAILIIQGALERRERLALAVARGLAPAAVAVVAIQVVYAVTVKLVVGAWPGWGTYLQYLRLYSTAGFGGLPVGAWSPGFLLGAVYFASALGLWFMARSELGQRLQTQLIVAAGFTGCGITTYTYFVGRSHPNNLHHIVVPAVALIAVWVDLVARAGTRWSKAVLRWSACFGVATVAAVAASGWGALRATWPDTALHVLTTKPPWSSPRWVHYDLVQALKPYPLDPAVSDGEALVSAHVPAGRKLVVLLSGEQTDEFLISTNRGNAIPLDNPFQAMLLPATRLLAARAAERLPPGAFVLTDSYPSPKPDFTDEIYALLARRDKLSVIAQTPNVALLQIRQRRVGLGG